MTGDFMLRVLPRVVADGGVIAIVLRGIDFDAYGAYLATVGHRLPAQAGRSRH